MQLLCEGCLVATIFYKNLDVPQRVVFTGLKAARIMDDECAVLLVIRKRVPDVVAASLFSTATNAGLGFSLANMLSHPLHQVCHGRLYH